MVGSFLLIYGLLLAGTGVAARIYVGVDTATRSLSGLYLNEAQVINAGGLGLTILGSGLAIGGIVRMIVGSRG